MKQEVEKLVFELLEANKNYRLGHPTMSDEVFDMKMDQLREIDPDSSLLKKAVLEYDFDRKSFLPIPMYSLTKLKEVEKLQRWLFEVVRLEDSDEVVISAKLDGNSLCVEENEEDSWTRGDGEEGQVSNVHYKYINSGPKQPWNEDPFFTFGEIIISKKNWEKHLKHLINPKTGKPYSNARNLVAGLFGSNLPAVSKLQYVDYIRYGLEYPKAKRELSKSEQFMFLDKLNPVLMPRFTYTASSLKGSAEEVEAMLQNLYERFSEDYEIDGLVVEVNDPKKRKELGRETNMNPAYARAYKHPSWSSSVVAKVKEIEVGGSKQGDLIPVVWIHPMKVGDVTVNKATGHNFAYIKENNICKGAEIELSRSGDVIPKHLNTVSYDEREVEELFNELTWCPFCGAVTEWDETDTHLRCTNEDCSERKFKKLVHFFAALKIEKFKESTIRMFWEKGYNTIEKILGATQFELSTLPKFGAKKAKSLVDQFDKIESEGIPVARMMYALDLFEGDFGEKTAQLIIDGIEGQLPLIDQLREKCLLIEGVSDVTYEAMVKGYERFCKVSLPLPISYWQTPEKKTKSDSLSGKRVCLSGTRDKDIQRIIEENGGESASGVSKNLDILVVKDPNSTSSKVTKARDLGVVILSIEDFKSLYE